MATKEHPQAIGEGLSLEQLLWLEASLWRLIWVQLDKFGGMIDPEGVVEAVEVVESGEALSPSVIQCACEWYAYFPIIYPGKCCTQVSSSSY